MERYTNDQGDVAVIISSGYGAGWSRWAGRGRKDFFAFDPELAKFIIDLDAEDLDYEQRYYRLRGFLEFNPNYKDAYLGGAEGLEVVWVPRGKYFQITEYDGYESVQIFDPDKWYQA